MRTFVRLLPRLLFLGVAAAALLVLAERERSAHADALPPITAPAPPAVPPLSPPPLLAPPPVAPPPVPQAPALPAPTIPVPAPPGVPSIGAPSPTFPSPGAPALPTPALPDAPDAPGVDPGALTGIVGPLPEVPEVSPPEPLLPELPEIPDPVLPVDGVLDLSAAPAPGAPALADALDRARPAPVADPAPSPAGSTETTGALAGIDVGLAPARGPPADLPGSPHPCPDGGSPHPTRADPAALLAPGTDDASRRAGLLAEARACASALRRDPLLRPD